MEEDLVWLEFSVRLKLFRFEKKEIERSFLGFQMNIKYTYIQTPKSISPSLLKTWFLLLCSYKVEVFSVFQHLKDSSTNPILQSP